MGVAVGKGRDYGEKGMAVRKGRGCGKKGRECQDQACGRGPGCGRGPAGAIKVYMTSQHSVGHSEPYVAWLVGVAQVVGVVRPWGVVWPVGVVRAVGVARPCGCGRAVGVVRAVGVALVALCFAGSLRWAWPVISREDVNNRSSGSLICKSRW